MTNEKKKILSLVYNAFKNDTRVLKTCSSLVQRGYDVELWAAYDSALPEYEIVNGFRVRRKFKKPNNKFFTKKKFARVLKKSRRFIFKVPILILKSSPQSYSVAKNLTNAFERIIKHAFKRIYASYRFFFPVSTRSAYENFPFDIIHCNDLLPLPLAIEIKKENPHIKVIYDSHEFQTETAGLNNYPGKRERFETLERTNISYADEIITVSPSIGEVYKKMYHLKEVHIVMNCPSLSSQRYSSNYFSDYFGLKNDDIIFLFQGGLSRGLRGIEGILSCFVKLHEQGYTKHHIVFMGFGGLEEEIKDLATKYPNIHFHPTIPSEKIPEISSSADYGIIFYPNNCKNHYYCMPNKLFEYLACGLPTLASPLYDLKKFIEENNCGIVTNDFTEASLLETLKKINSKPDESFREYIYSLHQKKYNWTTEEKTLIDIYQSLSV